MTDHSSPGPVDEVAQGLAAFVCGLPREMDEATERAARLVLLDSFAVALGALSHPAAEAGRRYAALFPAAEGALVWGTTLRVSPEIATLVNGVPLRGYDYNDLYIGKGGGGHPSDIVPGVIAMAEWGAKSGREVLQALVVGYEVALHLFDTVAISKSAWDYVNITGIAGTCAIGALMGLTQDQLAEALSITVTPHAASHEVESSELNRRGDLTMWKRFNGSDAVRQSVYACLLASVGVEGAVRAFTGKCGFMNSVNTDPGATAKVLERLALRDAPKRIAQTTFKRWPVGSRAQSAIQATLEARAKIASPLMVDKLKVFTQEGVYEHLVRSRKDPWHPFSRETADHSLPYVVTATLLDGKVRPESFDLPRVNDPALRRFLEDRVTVEVEPALDNATPGEFLSRVEFLLKSGAVVKGEARPAPGHPKQPFTEEEMVAKLEENAGALLGKSGTANLVGAVQSLSEAKRVTDLVSCLAIS